jgi:hypothetical protein
MINRNNIEYELEEIVKSVQITDYEITVKVRAVAMDEHSDLSVSINDEVIHSGDIADGEHDLKRLVNVQPNKVIQLRAHTNTHKHGKRFEIIGLNVNGVDIFKTNLWVMDEQRFTHTDGRVELQNTGLYHNGTWGLDLPTPLLPWLRQGSVARSKITFDHMLLDTSSEEYRLLLDKFFR